MPENNEDLTLWIERLKEGDNRAVDVIWGEYFQKLVTLARHRITRGKARVADEEDVALSALNSFFKGVTADRFSRLNDSNDLRKLLLTITIRKAAANRRRESTQKRGAGDVRGTCERLLLSLEDERLERIALYKMEGYTNDEISANLGCTTRTVERKLERIRKVWLKLREADTKS